ncbi:hypothetical protein M0804_014872 [Polistes exclamans]|nr:hypothetical protein M0804_014872 [Polistes exclamans]
MNTLMNISSVIYSPNTWLPDDVTWDHLNKYIDNTIFIYSLPIAVILMIMKYFLERCCFVYFGKCLGINDTKAKMVPSNEILEKAYINQKLQKKQILSLAKQLDLSERQIKKWIRIRCSQNKSSKLRKFCESGWRCFYYTCSFSYGLIILWNKPWLWDINHCYYNYPDHVVTNDIWWYYAISIGFYLLSSISQFFDVKTKDFWQIFIHHIITNLLLYISWLMNWIRIGSLILLLHDSSEIFLEMAKMTNYANYQRTCDLLFIIFTIIWIVTRIYIFPFWIINSAITEVSKLMINLSFYIFSTLLSLLFVLHVIWTCVIIRIAYNAFYVGQVEGDIRSESDESDIENFDNYTVRNNATSYTEKRSHKKQTH